MSCKRKSIDKKVRHDKKRQAYFLIDYRPIFKYSIPFVMLCIFHIKIALEIIGKHTHFLKHFAFIGKPTAANEL